MAEFKYFQGNNGMWGYSDLDAFSVENLSDIVDLGGGSYEITMVYWDFNTDSPGTASDGYPQSLKVIVSGAVFEPILTGPQAGGVRATAGTVTGVQYYDAASNLLLDVTGLTGDLPIVQALIIDGRGWHAFNYLNNQGNTYIGANDSDFDANGGADGWDGEDIQTGAGDDLVRARGGDDWIGDYGGKDIYKGGDGFDVVYYEYWIDNHYILPNATGIIANFKKGWIKGPDGLKDTIVSIEGATGTGFDDKFIAVDGADHMFRGFGGKDKLVGADGSDWAQYHRDYRYGGDEGIRARLDKGFVRDGFGQKDTVVSIENIRGTQYDDVFVDDGADNYFQGRDGNDKFTFTGTGGSDRAQGGSGADTFIFEGSFGDDTIDDFSQGDGDLIRIKDAGAYIDLTIADDGSGNTLITFGANTVTLENVTFTDLSAADFIF